MAGSQYKLSKRVQDHIRAIKDYTINHFSELQWHKYRATLLSRFQMLADNPELGKGCAEIYENGFYFPVGKHTAYFTKESEFILIVAVLSQSQLPRKYLG